TDRNFVQTGTFSLSLNKLNPPLVSIPITYGQTVTGTHDPSAELKLYTFTRATGHRVVGRMTSVFLPTAVIRRPDGTQLCATDNAFGGVLSLECLLHVPYTPPFPSTDRNFVQTGAFSLSLNKLNPPLVSTAITYGQTVTATHDPSAELKLYT